MTKPLQSQWDFDDLDDDKPGEPKVFSVSEITKEIKSTLERLLGDVHVRGEVSNLRLQSSGHRYFSLKDARSQIQCVLFKRNSGQAAKFLEDGISIKLRGQLTVYEPRGQYQIIVEELDLEGAGALQQAFEKLKQKLLSEGLFAAERKRPLPALVQSIGLLTSPTGAALKDFLHVVGRRFAGLEIVLVPVRVQGAGAAMEVARAIERLNQWSKVRSASNLRPLDLIVITRGGGSLEDLWAFNEESLARAASRSALPILSAIGHEIDFTILDFVADVRAATPSAAAEVLTEGALLVKHSVRQAKEFMVETVRLRIKRHRENLDVTRRFLAGRHPRRLIQTHQQRLDELGGDLLRSLRRGLRGGKETLLSLTNRLVRVSPSIRVADQKRVLAGLRRQLNRALVLAVASKRAEFDKMRSSLDLLSPRKVMERGYSVTLDLETNGILRRADSIRPGMRLRTQLASGSVKSTVDSVD